jgi:hypothetical protein
LGYQNKNERCKACDTYGAKKHTGILVGKLEGKRPLRKPPCSREDNAKTYPGNMMVAGERAWIALI